MLHVHFHIYELTSLQRWQMFCMWLAILCLLHPISMFVFMFGLFLLISLRFLSFWLSLSFWLFLSLSLFFRRSLSFSPFIARWYLCLTSPISFYSIFISPIGSSLLSSEHAQFQHVQNSPSDIFAANFLRFLTLNNYFIAVQMVIVF